ncbi:MAG: SDR family oxidoreductase [Pseudomonadales bacterium]
MANILVTGGCGYKGSVLVPKLLDRGDQVTVIDTTWFGNFLPEHKNLSVQVEDVRNTDVIKLEGIDCIIHLASIANDPCGDLNPKLTWEVSALATMKLAEQAVLNGVKNFIYASSGSVYGIKDEEQVTEGLSLTPISEYNKTKMVAERVLLSYQSDMNIQIIRPATVCGLSPRMRFDVSVNMLTMQALESSLITVFGGMQTRPNIHIDDITDLYIYLLDNQRLSGVFNAGFENLSIMKIAEMVVDKISAKLEVTESNDPRSYRINSDKLLATGFKPKKCVNDAIDDIILAYQQGTLKNEDHCYNLKWMEQTVL